MLHCVSVLAEVGTRPIAAASASILAPLKTSISSSLSHLVQQRRDAVRLQDQLQILAVDGPQRAHLLRDPLQAILQPRPLADHRFQKNIFFRWWYTEEVVRS